MKLSIIIPTFNNLDYLKFFLQSLKVNSAFEHEIILHINDGSDGEIAGEVFGAVTCNVLLQLPIDCSSVAGSIGKDLTENDGTTITQNLCISYDVIDSEGYSYHYVWICEEFYHPNNVDFSKYIPRFFSNPHIWWEEQTITIQ